MVLYNKAVRDRIPEIIQASGQDCRFKALPDDEFRVELERKLREEVEEYEMGGNVMELVDILEIVFRVAELKGVSRRRLEGLRKKKKVERGGFENNLFLIES